MGKEWRGAPLVTFHLGSSGRPEALDFNGARFARRATPGTWARLQSRLTPH